MKYLLVILVVGVALWMLLVRGRSGRDGQPRPGPDKPALKALQMVECAHCGLHLPAGDAVAAGSRVFCSEAHRALGARPPDPP